jgi:molybdenum-dependent DNA-binding transcriptional regulator ModE
MLLICRQRGGKSRGKESLTLIAEAAISGHSAAMNRKSAELRDSFGGWNRWL